MKKFSQFLEAGLSTAVKQRAADARARSQNQADDELKKAEKHPLSNIPFTKAKKKADDAGKKFRRNYIGTNPKMGDRGSARADLYKRSGVTPSIKLNSGVEEATYQGREVKLNKPMKGDVKKSKVYVDPDGDGKAKKVEFGDPNMKIKKNIPARRKSFRARHNCDNPGPKDKPRYWSCKAW